MQDVCRDERVTHSALLQLNYLGASFYMFLLQYCRVDDINRFRVKTFCQKNEKKIGN